MLRLVPRFANTRHNLDLSAIALALDWEDECELADSDASNVTAIIKELISCPESEPFDAVR
jgi:hypothetical protein